MSMSRLAGQAWQKYKSSLLMQDVVETAIATLGIAGAQALFSEMGAGEIAMSGLLGVGAASVGRPLGDRAGRMIGRQLDRRYPEMSQAAGSKIADARSLVKEVGGEAANELMEAKMRHHFDAPGRGTLEGAGSLYGRQYGDNVAQGVIGLAAPVVFGRSGEGGAQENEQHVQAVNAMLADGQIDERQAQLMLSPD